MTGTHNGEIKGIAPTGRHVSVESPEIYRIKDGKFVSHWCSTALGERIDSESLCRVMARYFEAAKTVVERHEGTVEKF